jgi:endonuclease/exonuclease/phosphatase family metal-dependent hydrolase
MGVSELKPKNSRYNLTPAELSITNYDMFHTDLDKREGRGCILYVHKDLKAAPHVSNTEFDDQVWAKVKLNNADQLLIGCMYRSPNSSRDMNDHLNESIRKAADAMESHLLIMGDFNWPNIDWETWRSNSESPDDPNNLFIETVRDSYLYQHINKPTRGRNSQQPHVLDLLFTNEEGMVSDIEYLSPLGKSDHCIITYKFPMLRAI